MDANQNTGAVNFQIPVIIPPELAELTGDLKQLKQALQTEIEFYRANREPFSYTEKELAARLGISVISLERIRRDGQISYTRVAGKIHYTRSQIDEFMEKTQTRRSK